MAFLGRPQGGQEIGQGHQKSMKLKDANLYGFNAYSSASLEKGTRKQPVCSGMGRLYRHFPTLSWTFLSASIRNRFPVLSYMITPGLR